MQYFEELDQCIGDACMFLRTDRAGFFERAKAWAAYSRAFPSFATPEDFYLSFDGEMGEANLCANIVNQFSRIQLYQHIRRMAQVREGLVFADMGCGSGALTYPMSSFLRSIYFVDVPNLAQEFLRWRCRRNRLGNAWVGGLDELQAPIEAMICIDVLEHIARSSDVFRAMHQRLIPGGLLFIQTPWASTCPNPEHLPEAEADWYENGGNDILTSEYDLVMPFDAGGLYHKKMTALH